MKKYFLIIIAVFSLFTKSYAQDSNVVNRIKKHINFLASDALEGRQTGSPGEEQARNYLINYYEKTIYCATVSTQKFTFSVRENPHDTLIKHNLVTDKPAFNVVAYIDNGSEYTVVIGAHYDHLGYGEYGSSLYTGTDKQIHNGADDNASGTAAILEIAEEICEHNTKHKMKYNYLIIHFSGEELGLYGSKYAADHLNELSFFNGAMPKINYMINLDMVGRLQKDGGLSVSGVGTSPTFKRVLNNIKADSFAVKLSESGVGPSDHTSFYLKNNPVLFLFSGTHSDYHKPSDDADKINYKGEANIIKYTMLIIDSLDACSPLNFTATKNEDNKETPKFKVTLGIMPDYVYSGEGVKVDGVSEGKVAAKAGILTGDVITKINGEKTKDIYEYMAALAHLKKGDKAKIEVLRNGKKIKVNAQF
jgi:hypothetical protein